jgi:hypothetical protein
VSHRKEQKEALRREREERERKAKEAQQRKRLVGVGAAGALALAAVVVIVVLLAGGGGDGASGSGGNADVFPEGGEVSQQQITDLQEAVDAAGCELETVRSRGDRDRQHVDTSRTVRYRSNPPALGPHWPPGYEAEDGLYTESPEDEALVHTLEHGRVVIWVKPTVSEEGRKNIRALFDEDEYQLVLTPRQNMPYAIAATAWNGDPQPGGTGRTLGCDRWSPEVIDALRTFRDEHRSNGPEPVP